MNIPRSSIRADLSPETLGVLCYVLSHDDDWEIHLTQICDHFDIGRDKCARIARELTEKGFLVKEQRREKGVISGVEWAFYDTPISPQTEKPSTANPSTVNPSTDNPSPVNPPLSKKETKSETLGVKEKKEKNNKKEKDFDWNALLADPPPGVPRAIWVRVWDHRRTQHREGWTPTRRMINGTRNQLVALEDFDLASVVSLWISKGWQGIPDPGYRQISQFKSTESSLLSEDVIP